MVHKQLRTKPHHQKTCWQFSHFQISHVVIEWIACKVSLCCLQAPGQPNLYKLPFWRAFSTAAEPAASHGVAVERSLPERPAIVQMRAVKESALAMGGPARIKKQHQSGKVSQWHSKAILESSGTIGNPHSTKVRSASKEGILKLAGECTPFGVWDLVIMASVRFTGS
jgi:hypothetical protein